MANYTHSDLTEDVKRLNKTLSNLHFDPLWDSEIVNGKVVYFLSEKGKKVNSELAKRRANVHVPSKLCFLIPSNFDLYRVPDDQIPHDLKSNADSPLYYNEDYGFLCKITCHGVNVVGSYLIKGNCKRWRPLTWDEKELCGKLGLSVL